MKETRGRIYIIFSALIFGLMPLGASLAYKGGSNGFQLVFWRYFIALPLYWYLARKRGDRLKLDRVELGRIQLLSLSFSAALISLYFSYLYIDTGVATTLHFLYPLIVILGCWIFYKEKVDFRTGLALAFSLLGLFLNMPRGQGQGLGVFLALFSALSFALYVVYLPKSDLDKLGTMSLFFYVNLFGAIGVAIFTSLLGFWSRLDLLGVVASLVFALVISLASFLFQRGTIMIGSQNAAIFSTLEPLTGIISGVVFLGDKIGIVSGLGLGFILLSSLILSLD